MSLLIDSHRGNLQGALGCQIAFGLAPQLHVSASSTYPADECYGKEFGCFFETPLLNLRFVAESNSSVTERHWLILSPGPDERVAPWAPFWVRKVGAPELTFGSLSLGTLNHDTHMVSTGFSRVTCWTHFGQIQAIELFEFSPYAAAIFTHESGAEWCLYAEYDFCFWFSFDATMIRCVREYSENSCRID